MNGYQNALVVVGLALVAIGLGYLVSGRKKRGTVLTDERIRYGWQAMTAWMLPAFLILSYVFCLVLVISHVRTVSVFQIMTYLWVTMFVLGIAYAVVRRR